MTAGKGSLLPTGWGMWARTGSSVPVLARMAVLIGAASNGFFHVWAIVLLTTWAVSTPLCVKGGLGAELTMTVLHRHNCVSDVVPAAKLGAFSLESAHYDGGGGDVLKNNWTGVEANGIDDAFGLRDELYSGIG